jgi:hypothetical protein
MISSPHTLVGLHDFVSDSNLLDELDIGGLYMISQVTNILTLLTACVTYMIKF